MSLTIALAENACYEEKLDEIKNLTISKKLELAFEKDLLHLTDKEFTQAVLTDLRHSYLDQKSAVKDLINLIDCNKAQSLEKFLNDLVYFEGLI